MGLKVSGTDKHQTAVEYAHAEMATIVSVGDLAIYDELRMLRNRVLEYPPIDRYALPNEAQAARALGAAARMVRAVATWWEANR